MRRLSLARQALNGSLERRLYPEPLRRWGRRLGYDVVRANYYSPIPHIEDLADDQTPEPMPGCDLRIEDSLALLTETLAPYIREYEPPDHGPGTRHGYYRINGMYPPVDGEVAYAMLRHFKPSRVIEVGAGFSTLVVSDALHRNAAEGHDASRRVFDPFPATSTATAGVTVEARMAQHIPPATFSELGVGDVLMIDTTHTVKPGGEVVYLILQVLPSLAPGVIVHVHDFFRPYEYPKWLPRDHAVYWQEHYLLQALLTSNTDFEVLIANYALAKRYPREVRAQIREPEGFPEVATGSALWIRRRDALAVRE